MCKKLKHENKKITPQVFVPDKPVLGPSNINTVQSTKGNEEQENNKQSKNFSI